MTDRRGRTASGDECRVPGCRFLTSENKPYCIQHLDRLSYVRQLSAATAARERPPSEVSDPRCGEALEEVRISGAMSPRRLADRLGLTDEVLERCVALLKDAGLAEVHVVGKNRRGTVRRLVALPGQGGFKIDRDELNELDDPSDLFDVRDRRRRIEAQAS